MQRAMGELKSACGKALFSPKRWSNGTKKSQSLDPKRNGEGREKVVSGRKRGRANGEGIHTNLQSDSNKVEREKSATIGKNTKLTGMKRGRQILPGRTDREKTCGEGRGHRSRAPWSFAKGEMDGARLKSGSSG